MSELTDRIDKVVAKGTWKKAKSTKRTINEEKASRAEELSRKHGFTDPTANASIEKSEKEAIFLLKRLDKKQWDSLPKDRRKHFENLILFHKLWDEKRITKWQDFYRI